MDKRTNKLVKNTTILGFGTLCTKGLMFIMTPLLTRWLTQDEFGTFDLLSTYVTLLIPFMTLCIGESVFRFLMENEKKERTASQIVSSSLLITMVGFIIAILLLGIIYILFESTRNYIPYFLILLIFEATNNYLVYIIRGLKKIPIYAISNILFSLSIAVLSIIFVYSLQFGLLGIVLSYSLSYLISSCLLLVSIRKNLQISIKKTDYKLIKEMLSYSLPLMPNAVSWWIVNVSDRTIISAILGVSVNAVYSVANKIPNLCQTFFSIFHISWQESVIESMSDKDKNEYFTKVFNNTAQILITICIAVLSCNYLFFSLLFSKSYFYGYYQVPILIVSLIFSTLSQFIGGIYNARMESKKNGITTLIAATINLLTHILLIKYIGLYAATISTLIAYVSLFTIRFIDIRKYIDLKFDKKIYLYVCILLYFFASVYINNTVINIINNILSCSIFIMVNKNMIIKLIKKEKCSK